jgi:hypothetical protein
VGRRPAAGLLVLLSLVSAGCGDELEEFRNDELTPLERKAAEQRRDLAAVLQRVRIGNRRHAAAVRERIAALEATYDELAGLDPPDDYSDTYARYVRANERFVAEVRRFAAAVAAGSEARAADASARGREAIGTAEEAIQPLHE